MLRKLLTTTATLIGLCGSAIYAGPAEDGVAAGNQAYRQGQYDEALAQYQISETEAPESSELDYNIGNLMHHMGKYEEALDRFNGALESQETDLYAATQYNMGNTYFRMADFQKAIEAYTKALEANPDDMDAKLNLELARKMLKDNMKPEQQENQDEEQPEQQKEQQEQPEQEEQNEEQENQPSQDSTQSNQQQQPDQSQPNEEPQEISKEDAERILNALKDDEQDVQKKIKRQVVGGDYTGNDW